MSRFIDVLVPVFATALIAVGVWFFKSLNNLEKDLDRHRLLRGHPEVLQILHDIYIKLDRIEKAIRKDKKDINNLAAAGRRRDDKVNNEIEIIKRLLAIKGYESIDDMIPRSVLEGKDTYRRIEEDEQKDGDFNLNLD